jgi:hypothetical protein
MITYFPEPEWPVTPQEAILSCSSVESTGPTPYIMTGIIVKLLQYQFSDPRNITNPILRNISWSSGSCEGTPTEDGGIETSTGNIYIGPAYGQDNASINANPALFVKREPMNVQQISQRNIIIPSVKNIRGPQKGTPHVVNVDGKHSIICKAKTGVEADALAEEVFFRMLNYMTVIQNDFRLGNFIPVGMSDVQEITNEPEKSFFVVVRLSWAYVYRWLLRLEAPIVKRTHLLYMEK